MAQQPLYQQIAEKLRKQIESGELSPGEQLPTEMDLRDTFGASRNTIRDAIKRLTSLGLIETRPGSGTFVATKIDPFVTTLSSSPDPEKVEGSVDPESAAYLSDVTTAHRTGGTRTTRVEIQAPPEEVALRLRIAADAHVISRHQERFIDETPWSLQTSFYPLEYARVAEKLMTADNIEDGAVRYLQRAMNLRQVGYRDWITSRSPDEHEQKFFGLTHDANVFVIFRTGFDQNGKPMRVTVSIYPADRNQFLIDSGKVPEVEYGGDT